MVTLTGMDTDVYVLQMNVDPAALDETGENVPVLGMKDGETWRNARAGNLVNPVSTGIYMESYTSFRSRNADIPLADLRGAYGFDPAENTVWAVLDYSGTFSPVMEAAPEITDFTTALNILQMISGAPSSVDSSLDVTGDGKVGTSDAIYRLEKAAGIR